MNKVKFGYGLQLSEPCSDRMRVNVEGYWTPWEDVQYGVTFNSAWGPGPEFKTIYERQHWGVNLDLERSLDKVWFAAAGLGYTSFHTTRTDIEIYRGVSESSQENNWDRLAALNAGLGIRWKLGPGDVRAAFTAGLLGYNFDNEHQRVTGFETFGLTLSYQIRIGMKR